MNYITSNETTKIFEITDIMVVYDCFVRMIKKTTKTGKTCFIPVEGLYSISKVRDGDSK